MYHYRHRRRRVMELLLLLQKRIFPKLFVCLCTVYEGARAAMQLSGNIGYNARTHTRIEVVPRKH